MANQSPGSTLFNSSDVETGTASNPLRVDPTNTTPQTVTQGTAAVLSGAWPVKVTDGTNTLVPNTDGSINVVVGGTPANLFRADLYEAAVAAKTYFVLVQLSNGSGDYKHAAAANTHLKLAELEANAVKSVNKDLWDVEVGTILAITGSNATIGWLMPGTMRIRDTGTFQQYRRDNFDNDLVVDASAGDYTKIAAGHKQTTTDLTTAVTIADVAGTLVTPAAGDLIMRVAPVGSVTGTILVEQHVAYVAS